MAEKPPCPDPDLYIWVKTRKGGFWRKKRGSVNEAVLNDALKRNAYLTKPMNESASRILLMLRPYLDNMNTKGIYATLSGLLKKGYNQHNRTDYAFLKELNLQPNYPLENLIGKIYTIKADEKYVKVEIPIDAAVLRKQSMLVSHYFFELILLQGDASVENEMMITSDRSDVYPVGAKFPNCILEVTSARIPWMVLLKCGCIESPTANTVEYAVSPRHYGMKVVAVG